MIADFDYSLLKGKKVLITGGLGFIGSSIAHRCVELGASVMILDACLEPYGWNFTNIEEIKNNIEFIKGDIRDRNLLMKLTPNQDIIFHMAAQVGREISIESPELDVEINCTGTINLLEACRKNTKGVKVVFAGSRGQIGEPVYFPVDENHPQNPTDIYGINKMAAEQYLFLYSKISEFPVVSLRLNNVYGPRCQMHASFYGILNWFMANAMTGKAITVYGEGKQTRDYVYIDDVVDAFIRVAISEQANGQVYFVGSAVETVFLEMVNEIVRAVGTGEIVHIPFPEIRDKIDIKRFVVTYSKINAAVGWKPNYDLRTGVRKTVNYYRGRLNDYLHRGGES